MRHRHPDRPRRQQRLQPTETGARGDVAVYRQWRLYLWCDDLCCTALFEISPAFQPVAMTGLLAVIVYAVASFSQVGVGWLIDRVPPKWVLMAIGAGQVVFVALTALYTDYALFFAMLVAMSLSSDRSRSQIPSCHAMCR